MLWENSLKGDKSFREGVNLFVTPTLAKAALMKDRLRGKLSFFQNDQPNCKISKL